MVCNSQRAHRGAEQVIPSPWGYVLAVALALAVLDIVLLTIALLRTEEASDAR